MLTNNALYNFLDNMSLDELRKFARAADLHDLEGIVERLGDKCFYNWVANHTDKRGFDLDLVKQLRRAAKAS